MLIKDKKINEGYLQIISKSLDLLLDNSYLFNFYIFVWVLIRIKKRNNNTKIVRESKCTVCKRGLKLFNKYFKDVKRLKKLISGLEMLISKIMYNKESKIF